MNNKKKQNASIPLVPETAHTVPHQIFPNGEAEIKTRTVSRVSAHENELKFLHSENENVKSILNLKL